MLVDEIWHENPPATAPKIIQGYVSQLRKTLGPGVLETHLGGYRFAAAPHDVDADQFEILLERGRAELTAGRPERASGLLRQALALWRGTALAEFQFEGWASDELDRLRELRALALESRLEADIALGNHAAAIPELHRLVREAPLQESLRGLLMLALYHAGRQGDALAVYTEIRDELVEELGVDPSESLRRLHADILRHDPALEPTGAARIEARSHPPTRTPSPAPSPTPAPRPSPAAGLPQAASRFGKRRRRWIRRPLTTAACMTVVAIAALGLASAQGPSPFDGVRVDSVGFLDAGTGRITTEVAVPGAPTAIAVDGREVWAVEPASRAVVRVDASVSSVVQSVPVGNDPSAVVVAGDSVWVANHDDGTVSRISPETNQVVDTIRVGAGPLALAQGSGSVWVTNGDDRSVSRIDDQSGQVVATIDTKAVGRGIVLVGGAVWVTDEATGRITEIDPATDTVSATVTVGNGPTAITQTAGDLWVVNSLDGTISRVDPATQAVTLTLPISGGASTISAGDGAVWVGSESGSEVSRVDVARGTIAGTTPWGARPEAVWATDSGVWVSGQAPGTGHRGGRLVVAGDVGTIDPSAGDLFPTYSELAYDGLTATRFTGGSAGTQIVPDLALSLPEPADSATTYTFRLRPNIRYSDGEAMQPSDFRLGLERLLLLNPDLAGNFSHVIGAAGCTAPPACDLSPGVIVSGSSTVTFHLTGPDPRFLEELTVLIPTPQGTQLTDAGTTPVPGTGPYTHRRLRARSSADLRTQSPLHRLGAEPSRRVSGRDRSRDGPERTGRSGESRSRSSGHRREGQRSAGRQATGARSPRAGPHRGRAGDSRGVPQHHAAAVQRHPGTTGLELRHRPSAHRRGVRGGAGQAHLSDPRPHHHRLPALLPLHHRPQQ